MAFPDRSPSAPVSRDDIARFIALQQLMQQRGPDPAEQDPLVQAAMGQQGYGLGGAQTGDPSSVSVTGLFEGSTPSFESGMPGGPGFGSSFGGGGRASFEGGGGEMTTANASMATGRESGSPFSNSSFEGGYSSAASQAGAVGRGDTVGAPSGMNAGQSSIGLPSGLGFASPGTFGFSANQGGWGAQMGVPNDFNNAPNVNMTVTPTTPSTTFNDRFSAVPNAPPSLPQQGIPLPTARPNDIPVAPPPGRPTPVPGGRVPVTPTPSDAPGSPGTSAPGGFGGFGGFGGGIDMSATGGYEGSASVGNTTGAAGFTSPGGGSGFGNVGGSQGSYGSYAGSETPGYSAPSGGFTGFGATGGYDPGGSAVGGFGGFGGGGFGGLGGGSEGGGGTSGGGGGQGGGSDPGGSPGGVG